MSFDISHNPYVWVAAFCTLGLYSILYRENRVYRLLEHIFIGLAAGYGISIAWSEVLLPKWWNPMAQEGQWYLASILPIAGLYYTIYTKRFVWFSRLIISTMFGLFAGQAFLWLANNVVPQIYAAFRPVAGPGVSLGSGINAVISFGTLVCVLSYFFFSFRHERVPGLPQVTAAGRWLMMIAFGAMFGTTVMARMSLFISRVQFLLEDWLGL